MKQKAKQLREMSATQLESLRAELQGQLRQYRFLVRHGELKQVHKINEAKKTIARLTMLIEQKNPKETVDSKTESSSTLTEEPKKA